MKKFYVCILFVLCFIAIVPAQQLPTITIVNNTGYTVWYLRVRQSGNDSWGGDRLGSAEEMPNGRSITLDLAVPLSTASRYDFQMEDSDGDTYTKMNVQISNNSRIVFTNNDMEARPTFNGPPITIVNNTGYTIWYVRISDSASDTWGRDRLGTTETLPNGQSVTLNLPFPITSVNRYDIQLEDSDGDTYSKYNQLVNANSRVVFTFDDID